MFQFNLFRKDKGMTLNGAKKVLNSEEYNIDVSHNTSINQKNIIKSKINKIKKILKDFKI